MRSILLQSLVDLLASLSQNLGQIDAREVMTPLLQRFFSCFDCIYRLDNKSGNNSVVIKRYSFLESYEVADMNTSKDQGSGLENAEDLLTKEGDVLVFQISSRYDETSAADIRESSNENQREKSTLENHVAGVTQSKEPAEEGIDQSHLYKDLYEAFKPSLAYYSYVLFCRVLGDHFIGNILYNPELIWQLCSNYDEGLTLTSNQDILMRDAARANTEALPERQKDEEKEGNFLF